MIHKVLQRAQSMRFLPIVDPISKWPTIDVARETRSRAVSQSS
jgi:hypothetical protein